MVAVRKSAVLQMGPVLVLGVFLVAGVLLVAATAQPTSDIVPSHELVPSSSSAFPVITHPASQQWAGISGDCVVYRDDRDGTWNIYLHKISTGETFTVTANEPAELHEVVVSKGVVVWRSE